MDSRQGHGPYQIEIAIDARFPTPPPSRNQDTMARRFFVGGNFKMNPTSVEQKKNIIDILNQADLDLSTGACSRPPTNHLATNRDRGRHCTPCSVPHPPQGPCTQGDPTFRAKLLLQDVGRFHGRDQVKTTLFMIFSRIY